jgi:outer membrane murein-binding lipoprotein Lpp
MSLTVTHLAEEVRESNRRLTAAIDALRSEAEDLRVEVAKINTSLNWMKGIGRVVAGSAVAILILVGTGVCGFGRVESEIARLGGDVIQLRKDTTELRAEFKARDDRLGRTLERIEKALPPSPRAN